MGDVGSQNQEQLTCLLGMEYSDLRDSFEIASHHGCKSMNATSLSHKRLSFERFLNE